jgi:hypothetical protein
VGSRRKADSALRSQGVAPSGEHAAGATSASRPTARGPPRLGVRSREAGFPSPLPLHSWPWDVLRLVPGAGARMPSSSWAGTSGMACSHPSWTRLSHCHGSRQGVLKLSPRETAARSTRTAGQHLSSQTLMRVRTLSVEASSPRGM